MQDPTIEAKERYLSSLMAPLDEGEEAARAIADGDAPNVDALDAYAGGLEAFLAEIAAGRLSTNRPPTEDDVRAVRRLAELARTNPPREELAALAQRVLRITANPPTQRRSSPEDG